MPRSGIERNPDLAKKLVDERAYTENLVKTAEAVVTVAKALAPVRTGRYRDGIKVVVRGKKVYASATDFKSHWIEWGSINNTPSAPLRRGAQAVGIKLRESEGRR